VQNLIDSCVSVLVTAFKDTILAECADMIKNNETAKLLQMYKAGVRIN
jgi:cullin-5